MRAIYIHGANDLRTEETSLKPLSSTQVRLRISHGGICGSDLHYFRHGKMGANLVREPMILGHEVSGFVEEVGKEVKHLKNGDLVAVNPAQTCGECNFCLNGASNQCTNMQFFGSAMIFPHVQGAFREQLVVNSNQCALVNGIKPQSAAMVEPLAVVLHGLRRAGNLLGKRVLVSGGGPIGLISVVAARFFGAKEIVVTDVETLPLEISERVGADKSFNMRTQEEVFRAYTQNTGCFDLLLECSGVEEALKAGLSQLLPRATVIQLGLGSQINIPMIEVASKELSIIGSWRFHDEFFIGADYLKRGLIDLAPLITHEINLANAEDAFILAGTRSKAMKVQIKFSNIGN